MESRERLRKTFDETGHLYHAARPRYPPAIFESVHDRAGIDGPVDVLEIGPATGVATEPMAQRGHRITAIELGPALAAAARTNLARFPEVAVIDGAFETWEPPRWGVFDLVFAATAWHWLDPAVRWELAHRHLRPGGVLAFWSARHVVPADGDPFFTEIQPVYDEIGESLPDDAVFPQPGELADDREEIEASGRFEVLAVEHHDWQVTYDAEGYLALLDTFSGHIAMPARHRARLHHEIRARLAARPDGRLRRHWGCVVHVARSIDP